MKKEQEQAIASLRVIEAVYEVDSEDGGFATVIEVGKSKSIRLENCKAERAMDRLAGFEGRTLQALKRNRCAVTGCPNKRLDYLAISPSRLFMAVPFRRPINTNHSRNAYLNNSRIVRAVPGEAGRSQVIFLSGRTLAVQLSLRRLQTKIDSARRLLYDNIHAMKVELEKAESNLRRLQRKERDRQ